MKIEFGHNDVLEYVLYGTAQNTVAESVRFIEEGGHWDDVLRVMNDPRRWAVETKMTKAVLVEILQRYPTVTVADLA